MTGYHPEMKQQACDTRSLSGFATIVLRGKGRTTWGDILSERHMPSTQAQGPEGGSPEPTEKPGTSIEGDRHWKIPGACWLVSLAWRMF